MTGRRVAWSLLAYETVNIDKVHCDIGSGSETAVSENFGGGFLSLLAGGRLSGGTEHAAGNAVEGHELRGCWLTPPGLWGNSGGRSATRTFF